jgi:hypothetical protein
MTTVGDLAPAPPAFASLSTRSAPLHALEASNMPLNKTTYRIQNS